MSHYRRRVHCQLQRFSIDCLIFIGIQDPCFLVPFSESRYSSRYLRYSGIGIAFVRLIKRFQVLNRTGFKFFFLNRFSLNYETCLRNVKIPQFQLIVMFSGGCSSSNRWAIDLKLSGYPGSASTCFLAPSTSYMYGFFSDSELKKIISLDPGAKP